LNSPHPQIARIASFRYRLPLDDEAHMSLRRRRIADLVPQRPMGTAIPRIIHQTYPSAAMPEPLQRTVDELRSANPGWEYRFYDDAAIVSFIREYYGTAMLEYYEQIDGSYGAARADFFRYLALYRLGGVYLDVKAGFDRPIDQVLQAEDRYILSRWGNAEGQTHEGFGLHPDLADVPGGEFQQWHIIAAPGHPFLRAVIEQVLEGIDTYSPRRTGVGWIGVLRLTGPIAYTRAIVPLLGKYPCRLVEDERAIGLRYSRLKEGSHQGLYKRHYTRNAAPIVARRGVQRYLDLVVARLKEFQWRLSARNSAE